jgi:hypothetical protein
MKKKRLVFPEKTKQWIDARSRYKLTHVQLEMARELGMDPTKFEGIAAHIQEASNQSLAAFIQTEYKNRFGKDAPDDRRSVEQKLKAESQKTDQKRMLKAETKAAEKWEAIPKADQEKIFASIWCGYCKKMTTIEDVGFQTVNNDLMLNGKCTSCGNPVGRFVEGD